MSHQLASVLVGVSSWRNCACVCATGIITIINESVHYHEYRTKCAELVLPDDGDNFETSIAISKHSMNIKISNEMCFYRRRFIHFNLSCLQI